jgi:hemerythrin
MNSVQFNDLAEHKSLHVKIINSLNELLKNSASFDIDELEFALEEFIKIGLIDHIIKEDLKIRNWIKFLEEVKQAPKKLQNLS